MFCKGGHPKIRQIKNMDFCKNCLTLFVTVREKKNVTLSVLAKNVFWTKTVKTRKNYKIVVSAEIVQNLKWHFFWKVFLPLCENLGFTNCVFEKLCSCENTIFIVLSENTAVAIRKLYVEKQRICEKWWVVFEHGKIVFFGVCSFWGFNGFVVCFLCVWYSCKSVKDACHFSQFWAFV